MTLDVAKLAKGSGLLTETYDKLTLATIRRWDYREETLERFASLVLEEAERVCYDLGGGVTGYECADAIRSLGRLREGAVGVALAVHQRSELHGRAPGKQQAKD